MSAFIFLLALLPPTISVLESAVRQQPAHHEYKKRQTSRLRKKKRVNTVWDRPRAHKLFKDRQAVSTLSATKMHFHAGRGERKH